MGNNGQDCAQNVFVSLRNGGKGLLVYTNYNTHFMRRKKKTWYLSLKFEYAMPLAHWVGIIYFQAREGFRR